MTKNYEAFLSIIMMYERKPHFKIHIIFLMALTACLFHIECKLKMYKISSIKTNKTMIIQVKD